MKKQAQNHSFSNISESILWQMPNFVCIQDLNSAYIGCNENYLKLAGYKTLDSIIGTTDADLKCAAAKYAEIYRHQDITIMEGTSKAFLDIQQFADGKIWTLLTKKSPLKNSNGKIIGCIDQISEINSDLLGQLGLNLTKTISSLNQSKAYSLNLSSVEYKKYKLSTRETECLFYLLRGKTVKSIAQLLVLSPRTVEVYVDNLKAKFNCQTKSELIEQAIDAGLLNSIPVHLLPDNLSMLIN